MERRMRGNSHVRCGAGEKLEIISKVYLLLFFGQDATEVAKIFKEYLTTTHKCFRKVIFAIPKGKEGNLEEFKKNFLNRKVDYGTNN